MTTKELRSNMKQAIEQAASGDSVIITMGRGKHLKKVVLSPFSSPQAKQNPLQKLNSLLYSDRFQKRVVPKTLTSYPDLKTLKKKDFKTP